MSYWKCKRENAYSMDIVQVNHTQVDMAMWTNIYRLRRLSRSYKFMEPQFPIASFSFFTHLRKYHNDLEQEVVILCYGVDPYETYRDEKSHAVGPIKTVFFII